ncbi:MAG: TonB-dependent receptor [Tannerella sp.]|jgi:TonB-linked SusC/RagA family outer membrane protein|nr:TonB-dependent receptor [Tannerella sp.]
MKVKKIFANEWLQCLQKARLLCVCLLLAPAFIAMQADNGMTSGQSVLQQDGIIGYVYDEVGEPIVGANVIVKGVTGMGTVTDIDGKFTLSVAAGTELEISYIGYQTQTVKAANNLRVALTEDTKALEEIVVVGYGTQRRSDITSSIVSVGPKDFIQQQSFRATDALRGRVAGVQVTNTGGDPFASVKIRIRGTNSINKGNDPLFVTNGVVGGGMPAVEDIESIQVLKDASATALYGSRGANGVILVTTKKGVAGKTKITLDTYGVLQTPAKLYDKLDAASFAEAYNYTFNSSHFSNAAIAEWREKGGPDWQEEVLQNAWLQKYRLNVSGGTEKMRFYTTVSYSKNEAMIRYRDSDGIGFSSRLDAELFKNVKLEWNAGISRGKSRNDNDALRGGAGSLLFGAIINAPVAKLVNEDGSYVVLPEYGPNENNFMAELHEMNQWSQSIGGSSNMALNWEEIIPGLSAQYRLNVSYSASRGHDFRTLKYRLGSEPRAYGSSSEGISYFQNLQLNYNKTLGEHRIGLTAVVETYEGKSESSSYNSREFATDVLGYWGMGMGTTREIGVGYGNEAILSYIGRLNYSYGGGRYAMTATWRRDGSSKFIDANKWGSFPSVSAGWRVSEEEFMKNLGIFYNLNLRASYGISGSQAVDQYQTVSQLAGGDVYFDSSISVPSYIPKVINTNLKWETTAQTDIGLDFGILRNRLSGTLEYYNKNTRDLLMLEKLPGYLGGEEVWRNRGQVNNKGVEFSLSYLPIATKDLTWEISGNLAKNVNKVVDLGQETPIYFKKAVGNGDGLDLDQISVLMNGYSMGSIYGYKILGVWKESEAAEAAKIGAAPGDYKFADIGGKADETGRVYQWYEDGFAGDGKIDTNDRTVIGCGTPDFIWGLNTSVTWKKFDANLMMQGVQGAQMLNVVYAAASSAKQGRSSTITLAEAWVNSYAPGVDNPTFANPQSNYTLNKAINTSRWLQDASFARIRNLSIGYTFDRNQLKYGALRIYVSAQNLLTLTKYRGLDPEASSTKGEDNGTGVDSGANPSPRSFTFGAQITF